MDLFIGGFGIFFYAQLVRAFPWTDTVRQRKPLSCHACMSGWSTIAVGLVKLALQHPVDVLQLASWAGVSYLLMYILDSLPRQWPLPPSGDL